MWADSFENIIPLCQDLDEKMIKLVWRHRHATTRSHISTGSTDVSALNSAVTSDINLTSSSNIVTEKIPVTEKDQANTEPTSKPKSGWRWNRRLTPKAVEPQTADPEKDGLERDPRPTRLYAPVYCGLAIALSTCTNFRPVLFFGSFSPPFSLHREWRCCITCGVGFRQ